MKFALVDTYRYWWPVNISLPDPDNSGKFVTQTLKMEFEAEDRDIAIAKMEEIAAMDPKDQILHEHDQLRRVVKNWDEVVAADKVTPVPFNAAALDQALKHSWFRIGVYRAYAESLSGDQARLGN